MKEHTQLARRKQKQSLENQIQKTQMINHDSSQHKNSTLKTMVSSNHKTTPPHLENILVKALTLSESHPTPIQTIFQTHSKPMPNHIY